MQKRIPSETEATIRETMRAISRPYDPHVVFVVLGLAQSGPTIFAPPIAMLGPTLDLVEESLRQAPAEAHARMVTEMVKRGLTDPTLPNGPRDAAQHAYLLLKKTKPPETFNDIRFVLVCTNGERAQVIAAADEDEFVHAMTTAIESGQAPDIEVTPKTSRTLN